MESALQMLNATLVYFLLVLSFVLFIFRFISYSSKLWLTFPSYQCFKAKIIHLICHLIRGLYNSKVANYVRTEILISKVGTVCLGTGYHGLNEFSPSRRCSTSVNDSESIC